MKPIKTICNEGCNEPFEITEMPTVQLGNDIEKTYFTCTHCQCEYVAYYTDPEIRSLQEKIRKVLSRSANSNILHASMVKQERKIQRQADGVKKLIAEKMDALRNRVKAHE